MINSKEWVSVRKLLAGLAVGAVAAAGVTVMESEALASDLGTFSVDCSDSSTLTSSSTITGLTAFTFDSSPTAGDTFTVTNTGDESCQVAVADVDVVTATGISSDGDTAEVGAGASLVFTTGSTGGDFTIAPRNDADDGFATAVTFTVDRCSLGGVGVSASPYLVGSAADFQVVGEASTAKCPLDGYYLQTDAIVLDTYADDRVAGTFTGTYDGDHYRISLGGSGSASWRPGTEGDGSSYAGREGLFDTVIGGTLQRIRLTGEMRSSSGEVGALVHDFDSGLISEVSSSVNIEVSNNNVRAGGIAGRMGENDARVQYSRYVSSSGLQHFAADTSATDVEGIILGGIVGQPQDDGSDVIEIRDSYVRAGFQFNSDYNALSSYNIVGGLVGNEWNASGIETRLVRNYAVIHVVDEATSSANDDDHEIGGLIGRAADDTYAASGVETLVSNFFLVTGEATQDAVGSHFSGSDQPVDFLAADPYEPIAVPVSATELRTLSTFISNEDQDNTGNPGGTEITAAASNGSATTSADHRWAITTERSTFVPSTYTTTAADDPGSSSDQLNYYDRQLYDSGSDGAKEYLTKRSGVLTAHGGSDPESTSGYTTLGNVWEICPGEDYPTLVWEEETCGGGSGSGSSEPSQAAEARSLGFTEEEYLRFLDSGLTWEQFTLQLQAEQSAALASTGLSAERVGLAAAGSLGLLFGGLVLLWVNRRRSVGRSST